MKLIRRTLLLLLLSLPITLLGEERSLAIVIDSETFQYCKKEVESYSALLKSEGLTPIILAEEWDSPDKIRELLLSLYSERGLEGAFFIGEVPIAMVRDAQHLTTAFKMDQVKNPYRASSVPSDRFYDDFDLKFDYLGRDSVETLFYYYTLRADSPQKISSDIYSGRLKASKEGEEGREEIATYLRKVVRERRRENSLDEIVAYTGSGSFSNSLTAWRDEGMVLQEQFPQIKRDKNSFKFLLFDMYPSMKRIVADELRREGVDLMLFHEHGMPERQYLTSIPNPSSFDQYRDHSERLFAYSLARAKEEEREELKRRWSDHYRFDMEWFSQERLSAATVRDSLDELETVLSLDEIREIEPNAKVVLFDACYNGDFRERRFIAGEYLFAGGESMVTIGNSVNVLQDVSSTDLIGMLGLGFRVGEWMKEINILESHIFGDPTYRFSGERAKEIELNSKESSYWLGLLERDSHPSIKGLALHKLDKLNYKELPQLLTRLYFTSPNHSVRLQVYQLLQRYKGEHFQELLPYSVFDPYEFIRRKSLYSMARIGLDSYIAPMISVYLNDYLDERVHFNVTMHLDLMDKELLREELAKQLGGAYLHRDSLAVSKEFEVVQRSRLNIAAMVDNALDRERSLASRLFYLSVLRNNPYHQRVEELLELLFDPGEELELRVALAEAFGWFTHSYKRELIVEKMGELAKEEGVEEELRSELIKSVARVKSYMR